ncbi:hypothetical protein QA789_34395 [Streptomyces sp. B21-088]|uniref:hypothetical protein n=1 Tax=Streptomyces sp. B21-088 TaxID=3039411 RepID=UPI002FF43B16
MMDAKTYTAQLAELRALRDDIKKTQATLAKLETNRARQITALAGYEKANAERIAPAAGLSLADVVAIAPILAPDQLANPAPTAQTAAAVSPPVPAREAALPSGTEHAQAQAATVAPAMTCPAPEPAAEPEPPAPETSAPPTMPAPAAAPLRTAHGTQRTLPDIPQGPDGDC